MKKSVVVWVVAFLLSLVPLVYLGLDVLSIVQLNPDWLLYAALGVSLLCTLPIWGALFVRAGSSRHWQDLLSLIGVVVALGYALVVDSKWFGLQAAALNSALLLGGWLVHGQMVKVARSAKKLRVPLPEMVTVVEGRDLSTIAVSELQIGDVILVRAGNVIPVDGFVVQGVSTVLQTEITGETLAVVKEPGDWVLGGTENLAGKGAQNATLTIRVTALVADSLISVLAQEPEDVDLGSVTYGKLSGSLSRIVVVSTLALTLVAAGLLLVLGRGLDAVMSMVVGGLVAVPIFVIQRSVWVSWKAVNQKLRKLAVFASDASSVEALASVNHVVLNKTGVITKGHRRVGKIHLARNTSIGSEDELLAIAAAVEMGTSHLLGHLIIQEAVRKGLELPVVTEIAPLPGMGISAKFDGSLVQVGSAAMVNVTGVNLNPYDLFQVSSCYENGSSVVFISIDELLVGYIEFPDEVREQAQEAIVRLSSKQVISIFSSDATNLVEKISGSLGVTNFAAEVQGNKKGDWIKEQQGSGSKILYVADGMTDAEGLAQADASIAFGVGSEIHQISSGLVSVSDNPMVVQALVSLAKAQRVRNLTNLILAAALGLAFCVGAFFGVSFAIVGFASTLAGWILISRVGRLAR